MKKIAVGLVGMMTLTALSGCGSSSSKYLLDVNYSDYVTLCDYKGIEATKVTFDISDDELQEEIEDSLYDYVEYDIVTDRGIEIGDYANVDYTATMDGEVKEDYSGEDEDVLVGDEYLYPEVEEALVGMKTGESKTVEAVLTDEFAEEEDVGKTLSVEITVNEISVENMPEYNEAFVKENTEYESMEAYEESLKAALMSSKEEEYKYAAISEMLEFIMDNSEFDGYPDELYQQCEENYDDYNAYYASMYGMEMEDYMDLFGIDDATRQMEILDSVNQELIIGAIAQKEKIDCKEKEIKQFVEDIYEDYGYDSADEFLEDYSEQDIGYEIIYEKVTDLLYDNATYVEITEDEYMSQQGDYEDMFLDEEDSEEEGLSEEESAGKEGDEVNLAEPKEEDSEEDLEEDGSEEESDEQADTEEGAE